MDSVEQYNKNNKNTFENIFLDIDELLLIDANNTQNIHNIHNIHNTHNNIGRMISYNNYDDKMSEIYFIIENISKIRETINDRNHHHFALIFNHGEIKWWDKVTIGMNHQSCNNHLTHLPSIHAEHSALQKLIKINRHRKIITSSTKIDMVVLRISKQGKLGYSRPCKRCLIKMTSLENHIKIKNIYYSDSDGTIKMERLSSMLNSPLTKLSAGDRRKM